MSEYAPGKKLPPHLSPFYEYDEEGIAKLKLKRKAAKEGVDSEDETQTPNAENNEELREMMISKNKKKLLVKIRQEKLKKKRGMDEKPRVQN